MKRIYFLSTCDKCKRLLSEAKNIESFEKVDLKKENIDEKTLEILFSKTKSYESLFNKRAQKYKSQELKQSIKTDLDFRQLILDEYTFLKRPVLIDGDEIKIEKINS